MTIKGIADKHCLTLPASVAVSAVWIHKKLERDTDLMFEQWEAECKQDREEGHRPHYCVHGLNLWTDYDPICGPCEDGFGSRESYHLISMELAIQKAKDFHRSLDILKEMQRMAEDIQVREMGFDFMQCLETLMKRYRIE